MARGQKAQELAPQRWSWGSSALHGARFVPAARVTCRRLRAGVYSLTGCRRSDRKGPRAGDRAGDANAAGRGWARECGSPSGRRPRRKGISCLGAACATAARL